MAVYKLKAKGNYGNMSKGYKFQVNSSTIPTPNANDIEKEIERLGLILRQSHIKAQEILK